MVDTKKIILIATGSLVGALIVGFGSFTIIKGMKVKSMNLNAQSMVSGYLESIRVGKFDKSYESLSPDVREWLSLEDYSSCMQAYTDEKGINFKIDESRQKELEESKSQEKEAYIELAKQTKDEEEIVKAEAYSQINFTYVPVNRVVTKSVAGKNTQVTDKYDLTVIYDSEGKPYIHTHINEYYRQKMNFVFGKALDYVEDSMEYENDKERVNKNLVKIEEYLKIASVMPTDFVGKNDAVLELAILNSFDKLIRGEHEEAIRYLNEAEKIAVNDKQKVRIKTIESEIYISQGLYDQGVNSLQKALAIDPNNADIRKDFRRVSAMMIDEIEGHLADGWAQLKSSLSQVNEERMRILKDIAMLSAEKAIKMKEDAPDGYFLKGSIEYALGDSSSSINSLEKALSLAEDNDTPFRTEVAQILGLARTSKIEFLPEEDGENVPLKAYSDIINTEIRSIFIRDSKTGGLIDSLR